MTDSALTGWLMLRGEHVQDPKRPTFRVVARDGVLAILMDDLHWTSGPCDHEPPETADQPGHVAADAFVLEDDDGTVIYRTDFPVAWASAPHGGGILTVTDVVIEAQPARRGRPIEPDGPPTVNYDVRRR